MTELLWRKHYFVKVILTLITCAIPIICVLMTHSSLKESKIKKVRDKNENKTLLISQILISNQFSNDEKLIIQEAANSWNEKTKGIVNFTICFEPFIEIDFNKAVLFLKTHNLDPEIIILDALFECADCTLGLTAKNGLVPYIKIVDSRIGSLDQLYTISLHELGHFIGLGHLDQPKYISSIMYPSQVRYKRELTFDDLKYFCDIYNCSDEKRREILEDESYRLYVP